MSADEMPWNSLEAAAAARIAPGLAGRVLAGAARARAEAADSRRGLRAMALCAFAAALVVAGYHQFYARPAAADRLAQWNRVAAWTNEFAAN